MVRRKKLPSAWRTTTAVAGVGLVLTVIVSMSSARVAVYSPSAKIAMETFEAAVALLAAFLIIGRQRQTPSASGRALIFALIVFGAANVFWSVIPKILSTSDPAITVWIPLGLRFLGATALAIGSLVPDTFASTTHAIRRVVTLAASAVAVAGVATLLLHGRLPDPLPNITAGTFRYPSFTESPVLLSVQALLAILFAIAALGFTNKADRDDDSFLRWVGAAAALGAIARLNYFLFPSLYSGYIFTGDLFRVGFYLLLLTASTQQILAMWRSMEALALVDPLTGLNNRRGFDVLAEFRIAQARREQQPLALVYIDLVDMKGINDTHGHALGDVALTDTAEVMRRTFRDVDILARLGGDEFAVLLAEGADVPQAADRLATTLASYRLESARPFLLHLSVGVAEESPDWNGDISELVEKADAAMYRSKLASRAERS